MSDGLSVDRLSIPLQKAMDRVRRDSGIFSTMPSIFIAVLMSLLLLKLLLQGPGNQRIGFCFLAAFLLAFMGLAIWTMWQQLAATRKFLRLNEGCAVPELILDGQGLSVPVILLPKYTTCNRLLDAGLASVYVRWKDIQSFSDRHYNPSRGGEYFEYVIVLTEKDVATGLEVIVINKAEFSAQEQGEITRFAQRFLSVPIWATNF